MNKDPYEAKEKRAERLARSKKKKKRPSAEAKRSKGKVAPGRKRVGRYRVLGSSRDKLPKEVIERKQAMGRIRRLMEAGNIKGAQAEFLAWVNEQLTIPNDNWVEVIQCELDWVDSEIGRMFPKPKL